MIQSLPLISVIVPHRNQPDQLGRCLESLCKQTFDETRTEIIVVDNGSSVLPSDICQQYKVRLAQEADPGPGPARNKGVSLTLADILAFIDADCIASPDWLLTIAKIFRETDAQIVGGAVLISYNDSTELTMIEAYESVYARQQKKYIEELGFSVTANLAIRRSVYIAVGPFRGIDVAEDRDWGRRATRMGYHTQYAPNMVVFHPARRSLKELYAKCDRQVCHDYSEAARGLIGRIYWLGLAMAIASSPLFEVRRIYLSDRIKTWRERQLVAKAVVRVRLYRSVRMLLIMFKRDSKRIYWDLER
jgi:glycosyltransferase involved in cell wall biosynthesis